GRELAFYGNEIPEWFDHQMQTRMDKYTTSNSPLMDIRISTDQNVRCVGVIFCFVLYEKETAIDATIIRGGCEVLRIQIVRTRSEDNRENGRDEVHLFICHEKHILVRSLQNGDRICIWARSLHPYPQIWGKRGGVHLLYRREGGQKKFSDQQQEENNLYHKLFLDLTWIQWSWRAWKNMPINFDIRLLAAYDLAGSFIKRKICTYSMSLASQSWSRRLSSSHVVHVVTEKAGMRWNSEECFELETLLIRQIEATTDQTTINMSPILLDHKNLEAIDGAAGRSKTREVDICVGYRWLEWRRLLADGRSELLIELGATKSSSTDVDVKILSISSIWENGSRSLSSRTFKQSHVVLTEENKLKDEQHYLLW
ncbi:hypothetical protein KI387_038459, partial [Taxus chinensis]